MSIQNDWWYDEKIQIRDIYFKDGSIRKEILIDKEWTELFTQPNAVATFNFDWREVASVTDKFFMPYTEAKNKFGHLPNFPKL